MNQNLKASDTILFNELMMSFKKRFEIRNNSCKILDIIVSYSDDSDVVVISLTTNNDNTVVVISLTTNNDNTVVVISLTTNNDNTVVVIILTTNNDNTVVANKAKDVLGNPIYNDFIIYRL